MSGWAVRNDGQLYRSVAGPEEVTEDEWYTEDTPPEPVPLPPTPEQVLATVNAKRDEQLALAALRIAPLQDAVDLDDATPSDVARLKKWKQYRVALNRIDEQTTFPDTVDWPAAPDSTPL